MGAENGRCRTALPISNLFRDVLLGWRGHRAEEFRVGLRFREPADQQFHGLDRRKRAQDLAQNPYAAQLIGREQQFILTRAGTLNVDRRENAFV